MINLSTAASAAIARYYTESKRVPLRALCEEIASRHGLNPSTVYNIAWKELEELNQ